MKRNSFVSLLLSLILLLSGCGTSSSSGTAENTVKHARLKIDDFPWNVEEIVVDGERNMNLTLTNNSDYTLTGFEIRFSQKPDITEEQLNSYYSDIQTAFEVSQEDMEELKKMPLAMYSYSERVIEPSSSCNRSPMFYYHGYFYAKNIEHYNLLEPDILEINYIKDEQIQTAYYDFKNDKMTYDESSEPAYVWSETDIADLIPRPEVAHVSSYDAHNEENFTFFAYGVSQEYYNEYVELVKQAGYVNDPNSFFGSYEAEDSAGNEIDISSYDEDSQSMTVRFYKSDNPQPAETPEQDTTGIRPEFKEAVDSYEAFYTEYTGFLATYDENTTDTELLTKYTELMNRAVEMDTSFAELDDGSLNVEEMKYYMDANNRCMKMILDTMK